MDGKSTLADMDWNILVSINFLRPDPVDYWTGWVENAVGKGEIACYKKFVFFSDTCSADK